MQVSANHVLRDLQSLDMMETLSIPSTSLEEKLRLSTPRGHVCRVRGASVKSKGRCTCELWSSARQHAQ